MAGRRSWRKPERCSGGSSTTCRCSRTLPCTKVDSDNASEVCKRRAKKSWKIHHYPHLEVAVFQVQGSSAWARWIHIEKIHQRAFSIALHIVLSCICEHKSGSLITGSIPKLSSYEHFDSLTLWAIQKFKMSSPIFLAALW